MNIITAVYSFIVLIITCSLQRIILLICIVILHNALYNLLLCPTILVGNGEGPPSSCRRPREAVREAEG